MWRHALQQICATLLMNACSFVTAGLHGHEQLLHMCPCSPKYEYHLAVPCNGQYNQPTVVQELKHVNHRPAAFTLALRFEVGANWD